jgi:hypothetical protein
VDELEDDEGLAHGLAPDDEDGDLGRTGLEPWRTAAAGSWPPGSRPSPRRPGGKDV